MARRILRNRRDPSLRVYEEDFDIVAGRFKQIIASSTWIALPGAVMDTVVPSAAEYPPLALEASQLKGYKMDTGDVLSPEKAKIGQLLSAFENRHVTANEYTLTPGVSSGLFFIAAALKKMDVAELIFELPAYFAGIEQAELLGLNVALFPASPKSGYRVLPDDLLEFDRISNDPVALVITQPRYGLGYNRAIDEIATIRRAMKPGDFIIIDEAADQSVPSPFGDIELEGQVRIIRIRGLTKGLGLNSAKIAAIFHPPDMRSLFGEIVDFGGGAIDAVALKVTLDFAENPQRYIAFLNAAQAYVRHQHSILQRFILGLPITLAPIESSYLATAHFATVPGMDFEMFRQRFLDIAAEIRLPIVRGSCLYFPYDGSGEMVRINYFTPSDNMTRSGKAFQKFSSFLYERP